MTAPTLSELKPDLETFAILGARLSELSPEGDDPLRKHAIDTISKLGIEWRERIAMGLSSQTRIFFEDNGAQQRFGVSVPQAPCYQLIGGTIDQHGVQRVVWGIAYLPYMPGRPLEGMRYTLDVTRTIGHVDTLGNNRFSFVPHRERSVKAHLPLLKEEALGRALFHFNRF